MLRTTYVVATGLAACLLGLALTSPTFTSLASQGSQDVEKTQPTMEASAKKVAVKDPFPLRKKYPALKCLSTEEFAAIRKTAIVIDARNPVEFDVIQVKGAINVPATKMKRKDLLKVRAADGSQPIVFYCNGVTCTKSYKGCEKARAFGFTNIFVYDAGVMAWATSHSSETLFFGEPMDAKTAGSKIISKEKFLDKCLDTEAFVALALKGGYKIFDIRDRDERGKRPIKLPGVVRCDVDKFVVYLNRPGAVPKSKVLVLDWVGKQVKWMQYYLEEKGHTEFYFLKGGIRQWVADGYDVRGMKE